MNVVVVDDERIVLSAETSAVQRVMPGAKVYSFQKVNEVIDFAAENHIDIALLDINIKGITGLQLAEKLQSYNPTINILFCTGYSEYSLDAHDLYCSAYLLKPVTDEKLKKALDNLRYPLPKERAGLQVQCFGSFEVYYKGQPVKFTHKKTKELLAYLIDRRGATASTKEIMVALYEDNDKGSYIRNLRSDLNNTLDKLDLGEVLVHNGGDIGVNIEQIECDYYNYLKGHKELFHGEYMSQYSFGEKTLGWLIRDK